MRFCTAEGIDVVSTHNMICYHTYKLLGTITIKYVQMCNDKIKWHTIPVLTRLRWRSGMNDILNISWKKMAIKAFHIVSYTVKMAEIKLSYYCKQIWL